MNKLLLGLGAAACVSACGLTDVTTSGFDKPSSTGRPNGTTSAYEWGADTSLVTGNRYAYEVGPTFWDKFGAFSGISSGAAVTAPPASGVVTMTGSYQAAYMFGIDGGFVVSTGYANETAGSMSVSVDYGAGTLTGGSSSGRLSVNGTFTGTSLGGTASFDGVSGPLDGLVGGDEAIGVFHGHNSTKTHAGGFIVNP